MRGNFNLLSNSNKNYTWYYEYNDSLKSIYHVLRPHFITKSNIKYWDFTTPTNITDTNTEILLEQPDKIELNKIVLNEKKIYITLTWKLSINENLIWNTFSHISKKTENNLNLIQSLETKDFADFLSDCDTEFDDLVIFFQKMSNYIQILQDNLHDESDIDDKKQYIDNWLNKIKSHFKNNSQINIINKQITYVCVNDDI